jgi:quercetin 2,3-dioxygenase
MITLRRSSERRRHRRARSTSWSSFHSDDPDDELSMGFGALAQLLEQQVGPGSRLGPAAAAELEVLTQVLDGALIQARPDATPNLIRAGESQRWSGGDAPPPALHNPSPSYPVRAIQLWLRGGTERAPPTLEQRRFPSAERRGRLRVIASSDGRDGALQLRTQAVVFSALMEPGQHLVHALPPRRSAWLQVLDGQLRVRELQLNAGDAVGVSWERSLSFTAETAAEILLIELGELAAPSA